MENNFQHAIVLMRKGDTADNQRNLSPKGIQEILLATKFINQKLSHYDGIKKFHILMPKTFRFDEHTPSVEERCVQLVVQNIETAPSKFSKEEWLKTGYEKPEIVAKRICEVATGVDLSMIIGGYNLLEHTLPKLIDPRKSSGSELRADKSNMENLTRIIEKIDFKKTIAVLIYFDESRVVHGIYQI